MIHGDLREALALLADGDQRVRNEDSEQLAERLYSWYLNSTPLPTPKGPILPFELSPPAALRAAHAASSRFEGGWRADTVSTWSRVIAKKGDLQRMLERGEYTVVARPGRRGEPEDALLVCSRWDWIDESTGFWHVRRGDWPPAGADRLVRTYWNCTPRGAPLLLAELTRCLDAYPDVPYMLKTPALPEYGGRADALVLYLGPTGFAALEDDLSRIGALPDLELRPVVPRMTRRVRDGVAVAEGNLDGDSFGQRRCRLIASTFCSVSDGDQGDAAVLESALADAFAAAGLDPQRPYLEANPKRDYGT